MHLYKFLPFLLSVSSFLGCSDSTEAPPEPEPEPEPEPAFQDIRIPTQDIDILFVIDDSNSMEAKQDSLTQNFHHLIEGLSVEGRYPDLHIGVVTTNVGAGPYGIMGCPEDGHNGILHTSSLDCPPILIDSLSSDGISRDQNFSGSLNTAFSCIANVGTGGCGFEQPLESMRRALDGRNPLNAGFLREDAILGIIFVTDEDDCSASNTALYDSDPVLNNGQSPLGHMTSFRCFEFGVQCDPDTPRSLGQRDNCVPRQNSEYLTGIQEYVDFLSGLKSDPQMVLVSGIIGNKGPVEVITDDDGRLQVDASCKSITGPAYPGIRMSAFIESFTDRNVVNSICNPNLGDALTATADLFSRPQNSRCIEGDLHLTNGQPNCTVKEIVGHGDDAQETQLEECNSELSNKPCFRFETASQRCFYTDSKLILIRESDTPAPIGSQLVANCLVNP